MTAVDLAEQARCAAVAEGFARSFEAAIPNIDEVLSLFLPDGYWRDFQALGWDLRTLHTTDKIRHFLLDGDKLGTLAQPALSNIQVARPKVISSAEPRGHTITAIFSFETPLGSGQGVFRLLSHSSSSGADGGVWKIWTMFTAIEAIKIHAPLIDPKNRPGSAKVISVPNGLVGGEQMPIDVAVHDNEPEVVIVGAAQCGLSLAARLKELNVTTLVLDRLPRVGDVWRNRFKRLTLHTPSSVNHLPCLPFPDGCWPVYTPKDKLADFFEVYAKVLGLDFWGGINILATSYDSTTSRWSISLKLEDGSERTLHPNVLVQATGHLGEPFVPSVAGQERFAGKVLHTSHFHSGAEFTGKNVVVVGAGTSGHDMCQDLYEHGAASVTLVQRSSTCVVSLESVQAFHHHDDPVIASLSLADQDLLQQSVPTWVQKENAIRVNKQVMAGQDREILEGLTKVGFQLNAGPDGAGYWFHYLNRGGSHYVDVGASQLIADGKIKIKTGSNLASFEEDGVVFQDGSQLKADVVIFATGFQNMHSATKTIFGEDLYRETKDVWSLDEEGELKTVYRDSGHPAFFYFAGPLTMVRYMSKRLALRIQAQLLGLVPQAY
ncbi:hypothetical protein OC846_004080 [Tilletia horrida]|uniref:FAD/NAD(P)-binding domain-containing protein n=1 Tax=Tilletia horrida TaxID=155126 RepID=A0AAN6JT72_9BASI|nr:hypothetical protein OC846_004080 [Tilletia horrida]KAK0564568.1 hypothetical protein OC861_004215 [Tilletia horrida]